jgi:hypothetical protein
LLGEPVTINGDGETSRDFCFVDNAVQANLLAATTDDAAAVNQVYNVAVDDRTSLNRLFEILRDELAEFGPKCVRRGRSTAISGPATCATRRPTSARPPPARLCPEPSPGRWRPCGDAVVCVTLRRARGSRLMKPSAYAAGLLRRGASSFAAC